MKAVIDTNVLLVANNQHPEVSIECTEVCIQRLLEIQKQGVVVIDDAHRILNEYLHKAHPNQPKGVGDSFLKWLLQNAGNSKFVEQVSVTEVEPDVFEEFPDCKLLQNFDPSDRKFIAVARAHPSAPPVWQAVDCKWIDWWPQLQHYGVFVEFLCPIDACRFYQKKFPENPVPKLPYT